MRDYRRSELIGRVAASYLRAQLARGETDGTARFIIDCLSPEQTAAIAKAILADPELERQVDLKLPAHFVHDQGLPAAVLTEERATYFRHAACDKPARVFANTGDDEGQSLKEVAQIGAPQLQEHPELWVLVAADGLLLPPDQLKWWEKALGGLHDLRSFPLDGVSAYVLLTRNLIRDEGLPLISALGAALPALRLPKDSCYFNRLNDKARTQPARWRTLFSDAQKKRGCFLGKRTPSQVMLGEEELLAAWEKVREGIPAVHHPKAEAFIRSPATWNDEAAALSECEWEDIKPLFDGLKREKFNLAQETINFYAEREPELLSNDDREYLKRLVDRRTTEPEEEDEDFYDAHRNELRDDRKLRSAWDRFVFGSPRETEDFLSGLVVCLDSLFNREEPGSRRVLRIYSDRRTKRDLKELNVDAGIYFARRYKGLMQLFGRGLKWDVGELFNFPELVETWRGAKRSTLNYSTSKSALQLKFVLTLDVELPRGGTQSYSTQLIWKFDPKQVATEFAEDWSRLVEHPLVACRVNREPVTGKGQFQTVDLANVRTFSAGFGQDRGSFVSVYRRANDLGLQWLNNLEAAQKQGLLDKRSADVLSENFEAFSSAYTDAIKGFRDQGLSHPAILEQFSTFSDLLDALCRHAKGDRSRELLLKPLLQLGVVAVDGGRPTAIVAPWQPLRLAAMAIKAQRVAELVKHLLTADQIDFGDSRLFFRDTQEELQHPFYPELVLGWHEHEPQLLSLTDVAGDYSLHESPVVTNDGLDDTNENPTEGAARVIELVRRYLALHPHEQANLSVVLYNCDSARLPEAVVDKIGAMHEDEDDVRCQVILRHRDAKRLRRLYENIIQSSGSDPDAFSASEATRDFMARLRIGIMADQAPVPDPKDGAPADIVFSQDVIARHARIEWFTEDARPVATTTFVPPRWSRRRPAAQHDMKSVVYLCCPVQTREGWTYLTAISSFLRGDWNEDEARRLLPARQLDFRDVTTARIFEETHNLANWVVNYDELLDRRQLLNHQVKVIRYKQSATQGRNVIISSKAPLSLLRSMVLGRLRDLNLDAPDVNYEALADRFIQDANDVSGDIVLRAAKRGRNASELMGIVLSRFLIRRELGQERLYGWYFLDDYAQWLGQREEQIADILALSPERTTDGKLRLAVVVSEAKYIGADNLASKRNESQKQLRDTVRRIVDAAFGSPERLDRDLWLARLSDLILDGVQVPPAAAVNLSEWRRAIREGACEIYVRGYSHVFVSGPSDAADTSDFVSVADVDNCYQEVFSRARVRQLVLRYARHEDPMQVRREEATEDVWAKKEYRSPTKTSAAEEEPAPRDDKDRKGRSGDGGGSGIRMKDPKPRDSAPESTVRDPRETKADPSPEGRKPKNNGGLSRFAYPSIEGLLPEVGTSNEPAPDEREWLDQVANRTRAALQQFQLQSKLLQLTITPNAALLKFAGSANLTVEQVLRRRSEFLTTHGLNIVSVQPEPGVVSLSVERPTRKVVGIDELWARWTPDSAKGNQELLIGVREENGSLLFLSPGKQHAPHTLIAGSTGSGKSVLMQNIILDIAATNTPEQAKIVLIDPKQGVDYFQFEELPHLSGGLIDRHEVALERLRALVDEMDDRYAKFRAARAQNLAAYNQKVPSTEQLPAIWLIHDEFAEWMMIDEYKNEVTATVGRLGVKARAAGIYLVFAAQRPDANVMPMQLRANLGNRLILRVDSEGTSEIALGQPGAERLLGRGHLLAKLEGVPGVVFGQVPFVPPEFAESVVSSTRGG
ncbi:MAG: FtsK/SpoIIIE domain-containing protein [Tepidisphaeraceae bacterium]